MSSLLLLLTFCSSTAVATGITCGLAPVELNSSTPNVIIVGDSISTATTGFAANVAKMMQGPYQEFYSKRLTPGLATVQYGGGFDVTGRITSSTGMQCFESYTGGLSWDVIVISYGFDDCMENITSTTSQQNLQTIISKAESKVGKVLVMTAPPVPSTQRGLLECITNYNGLVKDIVEKSNPNKTVLSDMYTQVNRYCGVNYEHCALQDSSMNYNTTGPLPSGQQYTGIIVGESLQRLLPKDKIQPPVNESHQANLTVLKNEGNPCGLPPPKLASNVKNVLIIGDSVSSDGSGFGPYFRSLLEHPNTTTNPAMNGALAVVQHNGGWAPAPGANEQGSNSINGVNCINYWLGNETWDVVAFNFGIHDCWKQQFVNSTEYAKNLEIIYDAAHKSLTPQGKVVWTSTTPIAHNCSLPNTGKGPCYGVQPDCVTEYNNIALATLGSKPDLVINDLYSEVNHVCGLNFTTCSLQHPGDVHPSGPGREFLAIKTAATILPLL
eukprot:m.97503 g.97503  ORF g.97503 m.97503 type:complete len:496 (+) comp13597_c0_seq2:101-1588(+)